MRLSIAAECSQRLKWDSKASYGFPENVITLHYLHYQFKILVYNVWLKLCSYPLKIWTKKNSSNFYYYGNTSDQLPHEKGNN